MIFYRSRCKTSTVFKSNRTRCSTLYHLGSKAFAFPLSLLTNFKAKTLSVFLTYLDNQIAKLT